MTRTTAVNFSGALQFPMADAGTDIFVKEDVQTLAKAVDGHDHTTGKGLTLAAGSIPNGTITSAMIADGTIVAGDIADGAVTSAKILDGTIAATDLADGAVTNVKLGADTARANLLTNGGFEIWQRGNGPFTATGAYTADRWAIGLAGTSTISISKTTSGSSGSSAPTGVMAATYSHNAESYITQYIQQIDRPDSVCAGRIITFALDVNSNAANAVRLRLATNGSSALNVLSAYAAGDSAWHRLSVTGLVPTDASTVTVGVSLMASCTAYLDNAMLVVGSVTADYAPLHPADDLARCVRYYQVLGPNGGSSLNVSGIATAGGQSLRTTLGFIQKAVTPTITKVGTWALGNASGQPTIPTLDIDSLVLTVSSTAAGDTYTQNGAGCKITIESNP